MKLSENIQKGAVIKEGKYVGIIHRSVSKLTRYKFLNMLVLPGLILIILFKYVPIYGVIIAFKNYNGIGGIAGIFKSEWIGFDNFVNFFSSIHFFRITRNTLILGVYHLIWVFPAPIILAILLNEITNRRFKKIVQSISYLPHFLSWVVLSGILMMLLSNEGPIVKILSMAGLEVKAILMNGAYFRSILVTSSIWKGIGWGTIIFLAAISNIPNELYEAAITEGANRFQRAIYITIPSIYFIITIMLILEVGQIIDQNFDQIYNLYNPNVYEVADVFETFIYRKGISGEGYAPQFSYSAAVGLFKSVTSLILIYGTNRIVKLLGQEGIW